MKSRIWTVILYVLAVLIIFGRIGNALDNPHPWLAIFKLHPLSSAGAVGANVESLCEDVIVFFAIRDFVQLIRGRKAATGVATHG